MGKVNAGKLLGIVLERGESLGGAAQPFIYFSKTTGYLAFA